ncbi:MAG: UbiX family flavin prenyltransferase [Burkholderiaceae bacterium]
MQRIIVGISGASGVVYGIRSLQALRDVADVETHLVMSPAGRRTIIEETDWKPADVEALADVVHHHADIGASLASGSYITTGMIVAPCSIKTLSEIAHSHSGNLLTRAADVCLKERRKLVLLVRETPLHIGHLDLMVQVSRCGAIVMPPVPAFYERPTSLDEIVDHTVGKAFDQFGIEHSLLRRWKDGAGSSGAE